MRLRLLVAIAVLAFPATAHAFTRHDGAETMDDGTTIATTVYVPDGAPPVAGWPGVILAHSLGASRRETSLIAREYFASFGYAVMTYDARGHGDSAGFTSIGGPREIADLRELERAFAARPDVDDLRIGAWGLGYGGAQIWKAAAQGVPFRGIAVCQTWSDLYAALYPGGYPKSGVIAGLLDLIPRGRLAPDLRWLPDAAIQGARAEDLRNVSAQRSVAGSFPTLRTPTIMLQGRRDFTFGNDQAIAAFQRLRGPKLLYLGDHGHAPSTFPADDTTYAMTLARAWLDHFVKGDDNDVEDEARIQLAPDPWTGKPAEFPGLPATRPLSYALLGAAKRVGWTGKVVRSAGSTRTKVENFGQPVVTVRAGTTTGWDHLVAVLTATTPGGKQILVSAGAVATRPGTRTYSIPLLSQVTLIPADSRLQVTFASSTAGIAPDPLYLALPPVGTPTLTITQGLLRLSAMIRPIS